MSLCKAKNCNRWKLPNTVDYFNFPVDFETRKVWAEMAGLNINEIQEYSVLCSEHFEETCFDRSDIVVKLKENSVPTIFQEPSDSTRLHNTDRNNGSDTDSAAGDEPIKNVRLDPLTGVEIEIKTEIIEGHKEEIVVTTIEGGHIILPNEGSDLDIKDIKPILPKKSRTKKKSKPREQKPRKKKLKKITIKKALHGETTTVSLQSPQEVKTLMGEVKVLKKTCLKQLTKIKGLNQKIRRFNQHTEKLNQNIKDLKEQNEEIAKQLENYSTLPNISPLSNDLMKRQLAIKEGREIERVYPPEVRDFSINLNCFSPLAYRYVRESFNKVLPHKKTLAKWQSLGRVAELEVPTTETTDAVASISNETADPNADVFSVVEQHSGVLPNQVKLVLIENGFDHLVTLFAMNEGDIDAIVDKNQDLPFGHIETLKTLPNLMRTVSQRMSDPTTSLSPPISATTTTASPVTRKPPTKTVTNYQVDRSSVVLKNLVCDWLNKNTEVEKPYAKTDVLVQIDSTAYPLTGKVRCVVCELDINVSMQKYKKSETYIRWVIANYIKHFKKFHITKATEIIIEPITNENGEIIAGTRIPAVPKAKPGRKRKVLPKPIKIEPNQTEVGSSTGVATDATKKIIPIKKYKIEPKSVIVVENEKTEEMMHVEYLDGISVANIFGTLYYPTE